MNDPFPSELFSAHHDGEVTPGERIVVEGQFAASAEARRERAEIEQLSELLRELPRESAPAEFCEQVMQAAKHQVLTPKNDEALTGGNSLRRRWWTGVCAVAVSAAMLFMMVLLIDRSHKPDLPRNIAGRPTTSLPEAADADVGGIAEVAENDKQLPPSSESLFRQPTPKRDGVALNEPAKPETAKTGEKVAGRMAMTEAETAAANAARKPNFAADKLSAVNRFRRKARGAVVEERSAKEAIQTTDGREQLAFDDDLTEAQIGQVLSALETSGDQIAVIKLTVVDRSASLNALQLLLERNRVPLESAPSKSKNASKAEAEPKLGGMVAVYVETTRDQLASTLLELKQDKRFRILERQPAISLASLDPRSRARLAWGSLAMLGRDASKRAFHLDAVHDGKKSKHRFKKPVGRPVNELAKEKPASKPNRSQGDSNQKNRPAKKAGKHAQQAAEKKSKDVPHDRSAVARPSLAQRSRQVPLSLSDAALRNQVAGKQAARKLRGVRSLAKRPAGLREELRKASGGNGEPAALLRVLLVLEAVKPAEGKPSQPAKPAVEKKKPRNGAA